MASRATVTMHAQLQDRLNSLDGIHTRTQAALRRTAKGAQAPFRELATQLRVDIDAMRTILSEAVPPDPKQPA